MSMTIESSPVSYSSQEEMQKLLDRLHTNYPHLNVSEYDQIAKHELNLSSEIEQYVRAWFAYFFYPNDYNAVFAEVRTPEEEAKVEEINKNLYAFIGDNPAIIADPSVVPMPTELRQAFIEELNAVTGSSYVIPGDPSLKSPSSGSGNPNGQTDSAINPEIFSGFQKNNDVAGVLSHFPSNSVPGRLFGFLGENVLLSRNVQAQALQGITTIDEMEAEIMRDLSAMETKGLTPDDPRYSIEMQKIQLRIGDLSASREELFGFLTEAQQKMNQLMELVSSFIENMNDNERQLASNLRVA